MSTKSPSEDRTSNVGCQIGEGTLCPRPNAAEEGWTARTEK